MPTSVVRCARCGKRLEPRTGPGRPRRFCGRNCQTSALRHGGRAVEWVEVEPAHGETLTHAFEVFRQERRHSAAEAGGPKASRFVLEADPDFSEWNATVDAPLAERHQGPWGKAAMPKAVREVAKAAYLFGKWNVRVWDASTGTLHLWRGVNGESLALAFARKSAKPRSHWFYLPGASTGWVRKVPSRYQPSYTCTDLLPHALLLAGLG